MEQQTGRAESPYVAKILRVSIATFLVAVVAGCNTAAGWTTSFGLFYAAVVAFCTALFGPRIGKFVCLLSALVLIGGRLTVPMPTASVFWNGGTLFGMLLIISGLVDHIKQHRPGFSFRKTFGPTFCAGLAVAVALGVVGIVAEQAVPGPRSERGDRAYVANAQNKNAPPSSKLDEIASLEQECMTISRQVLLGSRDRNEASCISVKAKGDVNEMVPNTAGDLDGGPGTRLSVLLTYDRQKIDCASSDFAWQQGRLRTYLRNKLLSNAVALQPAEVLLEKATQLSDQLAAATSLPSDLYQIDFDVDDEWPGYCLTHLNHAIRDQDLKQATRWAKELQVAIFALVDLHRWLDFLLSNYLTALDFQQDCQLVFSKSDHALPNYQPQTHASALPAGLLVLHGLDNFMEVERQAERLYKMPLDRLDALASDERRTPESIWVPPTLRECFLKLSQSLSPHNRQMLAEAARQPFDHSYLKNMLYRASESNTIAELAEALKRFDAATPQASSVQLLGTLMYRGHSFAGLEWSDRYLPELMDAAKSIHGTDEEAMLQTCNWTNKFYKEQAQYGPTLTLRDSLEHGRLDCNRATDMMGAIFRNSGRTRFGHVRICSESFAHTVGAYLTSENEQPKTLLADPLNPPEKLEQFPNAYFQGHAWPPTMENNPPPYSVELYARGLDNYIWAEGYIIRGPNAGLHRTAAIPYLKYREHTGTKKIFDGPYPD